MIEFNYYKGVRHTRPDREYLEALITDEEDNEEVINGIMQSKADFDNKNKDAELAQ